MYILEKGMGWGWGGDGVGMGMDLGMALPLYSQFYQYLRDQQEMHRV